MMMIRVRRAREGRLFPVFFLLMMGLGMSSPGICADMSVRSDNPLIQVQTATDIFQQGVTAYQRHDYKQAFTLMREAARDGHVEAMFNLGYLYDKGLGTKQDYARAMDWYRRIAKKGNGMSMLNIGALYENGYGVKRDYKKAARWYYKAGMAFVRKGKGKKALFAYNTLLQAAPKSRLRQQLQRKMQHAGWKTGDALPKDWAGLSLKKDD